MLLPVVLWQWLNGLVSLRSTVRQFQLIVRVMKDGSK